MDGREWIHGTDAVKIHLLDGAPAATRELVPVMPEQVARRWFAASPDDRDICFGVSTEADVWKISSSGKMRKERHTS